MNTLLTIDTLETYQGLHPKGLEGPRENSIFVAPLLVDPVVHAPDVMQGGERHRVPLGRLLGSGCR